MYISSLGKLGLLCRHCETFQNDEGPGATFPPVNALHLSGSAQSGYDQVQWFEVD